MQNLFLRCLALIAIAGGLTGCIDRDVAIVNPRTSETMTCEGTPGGVNPWSQTMACVTNHEAQGWIRRE
jgi:hypothetical protein